MRFPSLTAAYRGEGGSFVNKSQPPHFPAPPQRSPPAANPLVRPLLTPRSSRRRPYCSRTEKPLRAASSTRGSPGKREQKPRSTAASKSARTPSMSTSTRSGLLALPALLPALLPTLPPAPGSSIAHARAGRTCAAPMCMSVGGAPLLSGDPVIARHTASNWAYWERVGRWARASSLFWAPPERTVAAAAALRGKEKGGWEGQSLSNHKLTSSTGSGPCKGNIILLFSSSCQQRGRHDFHAAGSLTAIPISNKETTGRCRRGGTC